MLQYCEVYLAHAHFRLPRMDPYLYVALISLNALGTGEGGGGRAPGR